ncbi:hypothetical protein R1CP_36570 (plasmid) [Rhodococcus opacus]|uniref:Uncharacterized protein n=1 Tax=Rhodococcus opacus TaxID=37919 RepID=A0A1B1KH73_RHOOP|nr:hypothetical protein R1CP_36570 [Rhodococcus opacus]
MDGEVPQPIRRIIQFGEEVLGAGVGGSVAGSGCTASPRRRGSRARIRCMRRPASAPTPVVSTVRTNRCVRVSSRRGRNADSVGGRRRGRDGGGTAGTGPRPCRARRHRSRGRCANTTGIARCPDSKPLDPAVGTRRLRRSGDRGVPAPAAQIAAQSAPRPTAACAVPDLHTGGIDRPPTRRAAGSDAVGAEGSAGTRSEVVSRSNRSFGVQSSVSAVTSSANFDCVVLRPGRG